MTADDLIKQLQTYPKDSQVYVSGDPEGNDIRTVDWISTNEFNKSNNDGTYDAIVIWPTDTIVDLA